MSLVQCVLLVSSLAAGQAASRPVWERGDAGETLIVPMKSAPYPHASRENGFKISDKTFPREPHYVDNSVALFIPRTFRAGDATDFLVYFHGHYNNIRKEFEQYKLREQIVASGRNIVLIFPEGPKNAGDSGAGRIEEPGGLKRLVEEAAATLVAEGRIRTPAIGRVLIAGHSGAYRAISFCVEHGGLEANVSEVGLLDASYGRLDAFVNWAAGRRDARLFSIFTDHLAAANVYLMTHLKAKGAAWDLSAAEDAGEQTIARNRIQFLHTTKLSHDQTVQWLEKWLRANVKKP